MLTNNEEIVVYFEPDSAVSHDSLGYHCPIKNHTFTNILRFCYNNLFKRNGFTLLKFING
jgi:hypothetical protein